MENHYLDRARMIADMAYEQGLIDDVNSFISEIESRIERAFNLYGNKCESSAIKIYKFDKRIGNSYDGRNGNLVFIIIRNGRIITTQLRRDNQNCSAEQFGVRKVFSI